MFITLLIALSLCYIQHILITTKEQYKNNVIWKETNITGSVVSATMLFLFRVTLTVRYFPCFFIKIKPFSSRLTNRFAAVEYTTLILVTIF